MDKFFSNAIARLTQKGFSLQEAKALVATIRTAEDFVLAQKVQRAANEQYTGSLGTKVARSFRYMDVSLLLREASVNCPSPNQMPGPLADATVVLQEELLRLQTNSATLTDGTALLVESLNKFDALCESITKK